MFDALKRYTGAIGGFAEIPRKRAEQIANALAKQGLVSADQVRSITQELARRGQENREKLLDLVRRELPRLGVASKGELDRLRQRVQALEATQRANVKAGTARKRRPAKRAGVAKRSPAATRRRASKRTAAARRTAPAKKASPSRRPRRGTRATRRRRA